MINKQLKKLRKQMGISQDTAAAQLGVSLSSYQKYERDKNNITPSIEVLIKIADFYGTSVDYLLGRDPVEETDPVILSYRKLDDQDKQVILRTIQTISEYIELPICNNDSEAQGD